MQMTQTCVVNRDRIMTVYNVINTTRYTSIDFVVIFIFVYVSRIMALIKGRD